MVKDKHEARGKIINVTTELIKEHGDISRITVRDIALRAGVGVGLINYHFQTKENLIDLCIIRMIDQFIEEIEGLYLTLEMGPKEKLKYVFKVKSNFVAANSGISKISMFLDLNSGKPGDNTDKAAQVHFKVLKEAFGDQKNDSELFVILHTLMSAIQVAFLRNEPFRINTGIDFYNSDHRERFIDMLIDHVLM